MDMSKVVVELKHKNALALLQQLEALKVIMLEASQTAKQTSKLSDKYKGTFSKEDADSFDAHTHQSRNEWSGS